MKNWFNAFNVIPVQTGILYLACKWIPAFAGMTREILANQIVGLWQKINIHLKSNVITIFLLFTIILIFSSRNLFAADRVKREHYTWRQVKSIHFTINYPEELGSVAAQAIVYAEESYRLTGNILSHEMTRVIPVIIYPSQESFQDNTISDEEIGEGVGGFTESDQGRVVVPFNGDYHEFRHVLSHELVHAFQYDILGFSSGRRLSDIFLMMRVPLWMMEGLAEYISLGYDDSADMVMRDIIYNEQYSDLMMLTDGYAKSGYLYYKEGQSFFWFLEKKYGQKSIGELFRAISEMGDLDKAMKKITGKKTEELNAEWIHFYKLLYYPAVSGKIFDQDIGKRYTGHPEDYSSYNSFPAVSPDGKRVAYISNKGIYAHLAIMTPGKNKAKDLTVIAEGYNNSRFEEMHLLDNNLSWTGDGKGILFCARSYGRDALFIIDPDNGRIIEKIDLPFRALKTPTISRDGKLIAFAAQSDISIDLYIYSRTDKSLKKITNDLYSEKDPAFDPTGKFLVYSTNASGNAPPDSRLFSIMKYSLDTGSTETLISNGAENFQSEFSPDGKSILFISDRSGIFNIYRYDLESKKEEKMSDVLCGLFSPKFFPDGKKIAFVSYQNLGYDIAIKDLPLQEKVDQTDKKETIRDYRIFSPGYVDFKGISSSLYSPTVANDSLMLMGTLLFGTQGAALMGIVQGAYSDPLGEHRVVGTVVYYGYEKGLSGGNADLAYYYLKQRADFGIGVFTQTSPFGIMTLNTINELIHNVYADTVSMKRYGVYGVMSYPFTKFLRFDTTLTSSRYEWKYYVHPDVYANLNKLEGAFIYDTSVWSYMGPADGTRVLLQGEKTFNITGQDYSYTSMNLDARRYFFFFDYYTFAFRAAGGQIFGRDSKSFKYSLGGFDTLRGYGWDAFEGSKMFIASAEFRFITVEGIKFGFPLYFGIRGIGGVLFAEAGSTWDGKYHVKNSDGTFDYLKADWGFGFRLALAPAISLKLDFAWPYNNKRFGSENILFSIGVDY